MVNNSRYPPVTVVDENDNEIGSAVLTEVWQRGLYHRIVSIFIEDDQGRMLLQLRGPNVKVYPNCWDQAAGGHVDEGSTYNEAATNEVSEELGLHDMELETVGTFRSNNKLDDGRIVNQFERVFLAKVLHGIALKPELAEVSKLQWFTQFELKTQSTQHPENFTPGLLNCLRKYFPTFLA